MKYGGWVAIRHILCDDCDNTLLEFMLSSRALATLSEASYVLLLLTTICAVGLSCVALLSQAVRTSPARSWSGNYDALIIGAAYAVVVTLHLWLERHSRKSAEIFLLEC
jgi:hypothetical protein